MIGEPTVSDRGPAKHFHGRKAISEDFKKLLDKAHHNKDGTIFLIQGAPGAGKTALLAECAKRAKEKGWKTAHISTRALHDPSALAKDLGVPYETQITKSKSTGFSVVFSIVGGRKARERTQVYSGKDIGDILRAESGERGLLLVLDEAQRLDIVTDNTLRDLTGETLKVIHNGEIGGPVVLLAGGLGTSEMVFEELGISRFGGGCLVRLGRLSAASEQAVIRDWLEKDGGAQGDMTLWIEAIARESYGWPQHIMAFVSPATQWLRENGGELSPAGLAYMTGAGQQRKEAYYAGRVGVLGKRARIALAQLLRQQEGERVLDEWDILAAFEKYRMRTAPEDVLEIMLHKGVLVKTHTGDYRVPIPSMEDWLVAHYGQPDQALPPPQQTLPRSGGRAGDLERARLPRRDDGWER